MKNDFIIMLLAFTLGIIPCALAESDPGKPANPAIKNFGKINENYYRGGQPKTGDIAVLKNLGIRTVVNLRRKGPDWEMKAVRAAGMNYIQFPLSASRPATPEQTEGFLRIVEDPSNQPVFVHCAAGKHRTGGMTAIYRIVRDSWTADQAYREMKRFGFYSFPNHGSWKKYVFQFYSEKGNSSHAANPRGFRTTSLAFCRVD